MKERFENILSYINAGIYEKENETKMALLAALAGENIILLGPPGVAKSMIARRLAQVFSNAHTFEYLMSRFSTPDEIFGPVSISKLKESDKYERATDGYLPSADIVFLDEIWKAGPAIQNTLLTVINEKVFHNGDKVVKIPLKLLIAASNELPASGEGLEALWDRFLIRVVSKSIIEDDNFCRMLIDIENKQPQLNLWQISQEEYDLWQKQISLIDVPQNVLGAVCKIRKLVQHLELKEENTTHDIYISDRRWKKIVHLLRTVAFMHGRKEVVLGDLVICINCLWQETNEINDIRHIVFGEMLADIERRYDQLKDQVGQQLRLSRVRDALFSIKHLEGKYSSKKEDWQQKIELRQNNLKSLDYRVRIYDNFYCYVKTHGIGKTYFYYADFIQLSHNMRNPTLCVFYKDPNDNSRTLIRIYSDTDQYGTTDIEINKVYRPELEDPYDPSTIFVNGVEHHIDFLDADEKQDFVDVNVETVNLEMNTEVAVLRKELEDRETEIRENIFFSPESDQSLKHCILPLKTKISNTELESKKIKC